MEDNVTVEPGGTTDGQVDAGTGGSQITGATPDGGDGQAAGADAGTIDSGTPAEPTFFDPKSLPEELMPAYKQMQSAWTKKMQGISDSRKKIEAYDAFYSNPQQQLQQMATQLGYQLTPAGQLQQTNQGTTDTGEPQNWEEVNKRAGEYALAKMREEYGPLINQVQSMKEEGINRALTEIDPTWQQYEDQMRTNLATHPTLANDPAALYRMSVPSEVLESRATQRALQKLEQKGQTSQVSGSSTTTKQPGTGLPDKPVTFNEAVAIAKRKLQEQGITKSSG
jgi:hypothetical protein